MHRLCFLSFLFLLWGCSEHAGFDQEEIMIDQQHSHYHVHGSDIEHGHQHTNFQSGGHEHGHHGH